MAVENGRRLPSIAGVPMKYIALVTLTFQNSGLILVMHYSRIMPLVNGFRYYTSTAVLLNEVMKLLISLSMAVYELSTSGANRQNATWLGLSRELSRGVFSGDSWKLAIPAMLYTLQNSLQYVAVSNLDAATYQVLSQLKILTTAIFSVVLLGRSLTWRKWLALVVLMLGVGIVQLPPETGKKEHARTIRDIVESTGLHFPRDLAALRTLGTATLYKRAADDSVHSQMNGSVGLIAVAIGCMLSGLAGVYFEKVLKDPKSNSNPSVWIRNIQLSFYSLFPALFIGVVFKDGENISKTGFFTGYNWIVWLAITFQATGGVLVALVVKYADNIAKNFATSFSIIVSCLASVYFFNFQITIFFTFGTVLVIGATFLYTAVPASPQPSVPITRAEDGSDGLQKESEGYAVEMDSVASSKEPLLANGSMNDGPHSPPQNAVNSTASHQPSTSQDKREA